MNYYLELILERLELEKKFMSTATHLAQRLFTFYLYFFTFSMFSFASPSVFSSTSPLVFPVSILFSEFAETVQSERTLYPVEAARNG